MKLNIKQEERFTYLEKGKGKVLLLLHGLFGALSNFEVLIHHFSRYCKVVVPILPIYEQNEEVRMTLPVLQEYLEAFVAYKNYEQVVLLGNSLGGHLALLYAYNNISKVKAIVLTGSSGLFENTLGDTFPKRNSYPFIKEKTEKTFYDPKVATKELVDEVFEIVNNRDKVMNVVRLAKSAIRNNVSELLPDIQVPVMLIWGKQDAITPPFVAEKFHELLPNSTLTFIDKCGHAPMMEKPELFNIVLEEFLSKQAIIKMDEK